MGTNYRAQEPQKSTTTTKKLHRTVSIPDTERGLHGEPQEGTGISVKMLTGASAHWFASSR